MKGDIMKVKNFMIRSIAVFLAVMVLSLSVGSKYCVYNNISKAYAADPFSLTMGALTLEEIILGIAVAVLGADVAYQYRDEILDAYKEFSANGNNLYVGKNLYEIYANGEHSVRTWDEYEEILKSFGSSASESFEDLKDKFNNVYIKPSKEYLQYVADFYTDLFTGSPEVGDATYIEGLTEYLNQAYFNDYTVINGTYSYTNPVYFKSEQVFDTTKTIINLKLPDFTSSYPYVFYFNVGNDDTYSNASCYALVYSDTGVINNDKTFSVLNSGYYQWYSYYIKTGKLNYDSGVCELNSPGWGWSSSKCSAYDFVFNATAPVFANKADAISAIQSGDLANALNYKRVLDSIAVTGDDIPTVGNWEELWERLKNPDLPWWFCNPDALPGTNVNDLPWFDVAGLHDWANDIPDIRDGIIDANPDIPWSDVWDRVVDIPDVINPDIPGVKDPSVPGVDDPSIPRVDDPVIPGIYDPSIDKPLDLTDEMEGIADYVPTLADSFTDLGNGLKTKFPFSIPWDIHYILSGLATTPKAPRFELPLKVERIGIDETIVVDMKRFQVLSDLSRSIFSLLFAIGLINLTIRIIGSLKEE